MGALNKVPKPSFCCMVLQIIGRPRPRMPARKRPIPNVVGADPADAAAIDWSKFNWLDAERPFRAFGRIPKEARRRIEQATNHFARLAVIEGAAPPITEAEEKAAEIQSLTTRLLDRIGKIAPTGIDEKRPKDKVALAEFLSHRIRQNLQLPPGRNPGRASIGADHLSILLETLRALDTSLRAVMAELAKPEPPELREWQRWLGHICAALEDSGLPATMSNDTEGITPLMALVRKLLEILPISTASEYIQKSNSALAKAIQRSKAGRRDKGAAIHG